MLDQPKPEEILEVVAKMLREQLIPQLPAAAAFHARVAANAIDLVRRQIATGECLERASLARLRALLGHDGANAAAADAAPHAAPHAPHAANAANAELAADADADALERELCERIRDRSLTASSPGLMDHLMASTLAKMSIDQPNYASYLRALEPKE